MGEIRSAKIADTMLGREGHGIMTFILYLEWRGSACGYGGYAIGTCDSEKVKGDFTARGLEAISRILEVAGVRSWEELKGKHVRIEDNGPGETIDKIGNLTEEKWFNIREFFSKNER